MQLNGTDQNKIINIISDIKLSINSNKFNKLIHKFYKPKTKHL